MRKIFILFASFIFALSSFAQIRKIPAAVTDAFSKKYPMAQDVEYRDNLVNIQIHFVLDSAKMTAKYDADGEWKETEKEWNYEKLSQDVKDGFQKSKYATDWKVTETAVIYMPSGEERYRLKIEKNDIQKKYLFFDKNGRLVRDAMTI
jgi:Putative beta-lactamase-inhibitor-like, PepSY-like